MGGSGYSSEGEERLVLSEVHFGSEGSSTKGRGDSEDGVVISRYQYLVPSPTSIEPDGAVKSPCTKDNNDESDSEGSDSSDSGRIVRRRRKRPRVALRHQSSQRSWRPAHEVLTVVHRMATPVSLVGQQVWSAAFLLGDFVLTHEELFAGATLSCVNARAGDHPHVGRQVLELGAGPGVAGLIAARVAVQTFVTDYHNEVLVLLARNVEANMHLIVNGNLAAQVDLTENICGSRTSSRRSVEVRKLDWTSFPTVKRQADEAIYTEDESQRQGVAASEARGIDPFAWRSGELERLLSIRATGGRLVILASDIIYDEDLTEAFFSALEVLMPPPPAVAENSQDVGLKLSKCISSSVLDREQNKLNAGRLDSTSDTFHITHESKGINTERHGSGDGPLLYMALEKRFNFTLQELSVAATGYRAFRSHVIDVCDDEARESCARGRRWKFEGKRLPLAFQQCFRYHRGDAMEIWEIRRRTVQSLLA